MTFVRADSRNLPQMNFFMLFQYLKNDEFSLSEIAGWKMSNSMRSSYVNAAVGYVQLHRKTNVCTVEGKICPEHSISKKNYTVRVVLDEEENIVLKAECDDCVAAKGGCKHVIAFLMWLYERNLEPAPTEVQCYWKKPKLSRISNDTVATLQDFGAIPATHVPHSEQIVDKFMAKPDLSSSLIFSRMFTKCEYDSLNLHKASFQFKSQSDTSISSFISFLKVITTEELCIRACDASREQSHSALWHTLRYGRITASILHEASRATCNITLVRKMLGASKIPMMPAMERGKTLEKLVLQELSAILEIKFVDAGFLIKTDDPVIGASPDGISEEYVVEVKCPFKKTTMKNYMSDDGRLSDKVRAQLQLQMYIFKKTKGIVVIADPDFEINNRIYFVFKKFNKTYVSELIALAKKFWNKNVLPEIFKLQK